MLYCLPDMEKGVIVVQLYSALNELYIVVLNTMNVYQHVVQKLQCINCTLSGAYRVLKPLGKLTEQ
jgi:hypothetical protein